MPTNKNSPSSGHPPEPGVKAALVVGVVEAAPIAIFAAVDSGAAGATFQVGKNIVQGVKNVNEELVKPIGQRLGSQMTARLPGGAKGITDLVRGYRQPGSAQSPAGLLGGMIRIVKEVLSK